MTALGWWRALPLMLALVASVPQAQGLGKPTLEKVRDYGAVYVGHAESSVPFSYLVGEAAVGYSMDLCARIVDALRVRLGNPALPVVPVPVASSSRELMLQTGVIDLECGSAAITKIRQQSIAFSVAIFASGIKAVVRRDAGIERIADLGGKSVATIAGGATERLVRTALGMRNLQAGARTVRSPLEGLAMVVARQADAFVLDDVSLAGLLADLPERDQLRLVDENFGREPYGIGLRKDDPAFKKLVDETLAAMMKSGEIEKLYDKWFMSPIPPRNGNLRVPMSDMLRELFRNPSDLGI